MTAVKSITSTVDVTGSTVTVLMDDGATVTHELDPQDLRDGGWMRTSDVEPCAYEHCGDDCSCMPGVEFSVESLRVLEDWHNARHRGVFRFCAEELCGDLVKTLDGGLWR